MIFFPALLIAAQNNLSSQESFQADLEIEIFGLQFLDLRKIISRGLNMSAGAQIQSYSFERARRQEWHVRTAHENKKIAPAWCATASGSDTIVKRVAIPSKSCSDTAMTITKWHLYCQRDADISLARHHSNIAEPKVRYANIRWSNWTVKMSSNTASHHGFPSYKSTGTSASAIKGHVL